jgi:hypothetical protein
MAPRKTNYINNKDLLKALIDYRERLHKCIAEDKPKPQVSNYIGQAILLICDNLAKRPNFSGYTYKQDMISDGVIMSIAAVDNFDPTKTENPFGYFTQIAWNAFLQRIAKEKKQTYLKHKNFENVFLMNNLWTDAENMHLTSNEFSDRIITDFESKIKLTSDKKDTILKGIEKFEED